LDQWRV